MNQNEEFKFDVHPDHNVMFSICPICGEGLVEWINVNDVGYFEMSTGDDAADGYPEYDTFYLKPSMNRECEFCGSQIMFDQPLTVEELKEFIIKTREYLKGV